MEWSVVCISSLTHRVILVQLHQLEYRERYSSSLNCLCLTNPPVFEGLFGSLLLASHQWQSCFRISWAVISAGGVQGIEVCSLWTVNWIYLTVRQHFHPWRRKQSCWICKSCPEAHYFLQNCTLNWEAWHIELLFCYFLKIFTNIWVGQGPPHSDGCTYTSYL